MVSHSIHTLPTSQLSSQRHASQLTKSYRHHTSQLITSCQLYASQLIVSCQCHTSLLTMRYITIDENLPLTVYFENVEMLELLYTSVYKCNFKVRGTFSKEVQYREGFDLLIDADSDG